jgi:hypothetical protein
MITIGEQLVSRLASKTSAVLLTGRAMPLRFVAAGAVIVVMAGGCGHESASVTPASARVLTVACGNIIGSVRSVTDPGYRLVLGRLEVPFVRLQRPAATAQRRWPYFSKFGLVVQAGRTPLTVSVPSRWSHRAAISWGNGLPTVQTLRIAGCAPSPHRWNAYAGGVFTRNPTACVPLIFEVDGRSQTVKFGLGRSCAGKT